MKWLGKASEWVFKGLHFAESIVSLPKALSEPIHFREDWQSHLQNFAERPTLWIHGASVGELEDLANFFLDPELLLDAGYKPENVIITSSSPSAREFLARLKNKHGFLYAGPVPSEDSTQILRFLKQLRPELLLLSHSDLWPNLMQLAQDHALEKGIVWMPTKASSGKTLFEKIVQSQKLLAIGARKSSDVPLLKERFKDYPSTTIKWIGNPRLDRISSRIAKQKLGNQHVLEDSRALPNKAKLSVMLGSIWPEDAAALAEALNGLSPEIQESIQLVAIPHITDDIHLVASIQHLLPMARILRIQGVLLEAYQGFDVAFVGGGFRTGLHSVLEPALWGMPILCGPLLSKQTEAPELEEAGGLLRITSTDELRLRLTEWAQSRDSLAATKERAAKLAAQIKASTGGSKRLSQLLRTFKV